MTARLCRRAAKCTKTRRTCSDCPPAASRSAPAGVGSKRTAMASAGMGVFRCADGVMKRAFAGEASVEQMTVGVRRDALALPVVAWKSSIQNSAGGACGAGSVWGGWLGWTSGAPGSAGEGTVGSLGAGTGSSTGRTVGSSGCVAMEPPMKRFEGSAHLATRSCRDHHRERRSDRRS